MRILGVAFIWAALCALPDGTAPAQEPAGEVAYWCVWTGDAGLEIGRLGDSGSADCQGEVFVVGHRAWGHAEGPVSSPILTEPAGTVEVGVRTGTLDERPLPDAFLGQALREPGAETSLERVLCRRSAPEETATEARYLCVVPVGTTAAKLVPDGFAPIFLWDLSMAEGETVTARARLRPGARLFGRVDASGLTARWFPRGIERSEPSMELASIVRELPEGGDFVFEDIASGAYVYRLESSTGASSEIEVVVPPSVRQMELPRIREPTWVDIEVRLSPGVDGDGDGWALTLIPRSGSLGRVGAVGVQADGSGWATFERVDPGSYLLLVEDGAGSLWSTHELDIEGSDVFWVELGHVSIRGTALIGDQPYSGTLVFGTTQGSRRVFVRTDRHGRFEGLLPSEGLWDVEVSVDELGCDECGGTPGTIRVPSVEVEEGPSGEALFDLLIPDTRLEGTVVREELLPSGGSVKRPQAGALVLVTRAAGPVRSRGRQAQIWTDDAGRFEIRGIEEGEVQVGAVLRDPPCESTWQAVRLESGVEGRPVELVLEEKASMTVRVLAAGQPVGGARVTALVDGGLSKRGMTGPGGFVSLEVPRNRSGTLVVVAAGYGVVLQGFEVEPPGSGDPEVAVPLLPGAGTLALTQLREDILDSGWLSSDRRGVVGLRLLPNLLPSGVSFGEKITISGLSPGSYELCLGERPCWSVTVFPDGVTEIDLSKE